MNARAVLMAVLLAAGAALPVAAAQPKIPANELPGHERERFIDPFPAPPRSEPVIIAPRQMRLKRPCRDPRRAKQSRNRC